MKVTMGQGIIEVSAIMKNREDADDLLKMLTIAAPWLPCRPSPKWPSQLRAYIEAGEKNHAIKLWRAVAHEPLKEAKDYVDGLVAGTIQWPNGREYPDPTETGT